MQFEEVKLYNPGILCSTMPESVFEDLKKSCQFQIDNKNVAKTLKKLTFDDFDVSGLQESFTINVPNSFRNYLQDFAQEYARFYNSKIPQPKLLQTWVNLQKKHEFRPLHKHLDMTGNGLSFVTYISIPYDLEKEDTYENHHNRATIHRNGRLEFMYNSYTGQQLTYRLDIDKSYEGKTVLFLNSLSHQVYPFYTSDDYRISVAGNIVFV